VKAWLGFFAVLVPPSPKFHLQKVGSPEVVSANCTICPGAGAEGLKTKVAGEFEGKTVRVLVAFFELVLLAAIRVTLWKPDAE